ncbi:MAG: hypothetical protein AB1758_34075, partial [Candidatus Eremiobacterota bacterium]
MRPFVLCFLLMVTGCASGPPVAPITPIASPTTATPTPVATLAQASPAGSLEDFARRIVGRQSYGLYMGGKKIGWARLEFTTEKREGRTVAVFSEEFHMRATFRGEKLQVSSQARTVFSTEGDGPILEASESRDEDGTKTDIRVTRAGEGVLVSIRTASGTDRRKLPLPRERLSVFRDVESWTLRAAPGETFDQPSVTWDEDPAETVDHLTMLGQETILWGGVRTQVYQVKVESRGMKTEALVRADGTPWKATVGGVMEMRAEDEAVARRMDAVVDMLDVSAIRLDRPLGDPEKLTRLVLEVGDDRGFQLPASHRQIVRQEKGRLLWEIKRDFRLEKPQPIAREERERCLRSTPSVQVDAAMRKVAADVLAGRGRAPRGEARRHG